MIKKIVFMATLFLLSTSLAQKVEYSISPFITLQNKNLKSSYGLQLGLEYIHHKHYGLKISGGLFSPDNNTEDIFLGHIPTTISWLDLSIKYYPIKNYFNPYFGIGMGKFFNDRDWNGNSHGNEKLEVLNADLDNNIGYNFLVGIRAYRNLHIEFRYLILNTRMNREVVYKGESNSFISEKLDVNLNSMFIILSYVF